MIVGIPRVTHRNEFRVGLTPFGVCGAFALVGEQSTPGGEPCAPASFVERAEEGDSRCLVGRGLYRRLRIADPVL